MNVSITIWDSCIHLLPFPSICNICHNDKYFKLTFSKFVCSSEFTYLSNFHTFVSLGSLTLFHHNYPPIIVRHMTSVLKLMILTSDM